MGAPGSVCTGIIVSRDNWCKARIDGYPPVLLPLCVWVSGLGILHVAAGRLDRRGVMSKLCAALVGVSLLALSFIALFAVPAAADLDPSWRDTETTTSYVFVS